MAEELKGILGRKRLLSDDMLENWAERKKRPKIE